MNKCSLAILLLLLQLGCRKQIEQVYPTPIDTSMIQKVKKIVVLGNSIVQYGPDQSIGWKGNWGLAASRKENDFIHLLMQNLQAKRNDVEVRFKNIADFESTYLTYSLSTLDSLRDADMVIIKIAENVKSSQPSYRQFIAKYDKMIHYLDPSGKVVKLIIDGFWKNEKVNNDIRNYAMQHKIALVSITDISSDSKNRGIAGHPNDRGMKIINDRVWRYVSHYF